MKWIWTRLRVLLLFFAAGHPVLTRNLQGKEDTGMIGAKLSEVEKTHDLFTFFHLTQTGSEGLPDHRTRVSFQPSGEAFHDLVTLRVTTDGHGIVEGLDLEVARSFIDDRRQGIFAADLIKTYLGSVGNAPANEEVAALAREIEARAMMNSGSPVLTARPTPEVPKETSVAYDVYAGRSPAQTLPKRSNGLQATLKNLSPGGRAVLAITMSLERP